MSAILLSSRYLPLRGTLQAQLRGMPPPPFSPPSDPAQRLLQGPPAKSNFLAAKSLMKRGSEHQFHKSTTTGPGHTAVYCYFSSLITAHSALFTTSSPSFPRNPLSPALRSGPTAGSGASPKTKLLAAPSTAPPGSFLGSVPATPFWGQSPQRNNPLSPLSDPSNGTPKRPTPKANS